MSTIEITISGPEAESAADALAEALGLDRLPGRPAGDQARPATKGLDPALLIAGASLIVGIPGAVLAALDIAERLKKRPRAEALIATARRLRIERRVEVTTLTVDGPVALAELDPDRLLEIARGAEGRGGGGAGAD